jgi:hypothetical protein
VEWREVRSRRSDPGQRIPTVKHRASVRMLQAASGL